MRESILGVDIGTSSIKSTLYELDGTEIASSSSEYSCIHSRPGWIEIDTDILWRTVARSIRQITEQVSGRHDIIAVGVCGLMIVPVFLDKTCGVVRPPISWLDERLEAQCVQLKKEGVDTIVRQCSRATITGESTVNAMLWLKRNEPESFQRTTKFCMIKDFIRFRFTNNLMTDFGDASGTLMFDSREWRWCSDAIAELGLNQAIFPDLKRPTEIGGYVTREASEFTGLREGVPVAVGSGDGITTILGLGVYRDGQVGVTVGSAGVVMAASTRFPEDDQCRGYIMCHPMCDRWYSVMATASSGEALRWFKTSVVSDPQITYEMLEREAQESQVGSDGLVFLPYLVGARNPHGNPAAFGAFLGLRLKHKRSHLTRAVMEGICLELADILAVQEEILGGHGMGIEEVRLSGGIARSRFWTQMLSNVLGVDLSMTRAKELGTLGSAVIAATAVGAHGSLKAAIDSMVVSDEVVRADQEMADTYSKKLALFRHLYHILEDEFNTMHVW